MTCAKRAPAHTLWRFHIHCDVCKYTVAFKFCPIRRLDKLMGYGCRLTSGLLVVHGRSHVHGQPYLSFCPITLQHLSFRS
jgi:hypothetical protein